MDRLELEEPAAEHRCQGEGDEQAHHDGERDGQPEAGKEPADNSPHERNRHEDDHEREAGRQHGQSDLTGPLSRGRHAVHPVLFHVAEDVFMDDHGIVDHDADRQNRARAS